MNQKVLINGGSGFIGKILIDLLQSNGYSISILSRGGVNLDNVKTYHWNPEVGEFDTEALKGLYGIIHLAGAGIADKKWSKQRKSEIVDSRVKSSQLILDKLAQLDESDHPEVFISASAVGIYGYDTGSLLIKETSRFGDDFLATLCKEWEAAADNFRDQVNRVVKLRIGFVMGNMGGALEAMKKPVRFGLGAGIGRGDQYISWIHAEDLARMFMYALKNTNIQGVYNAVGPNPATNKDLMKSLAKAMKKPFFLPNVPSFGLRLVMGEMASLVTGGTRVSCEKMKSKGFDFNYSELNPALDNLLKSQ